MAAQPIQSRIRMSHLLNGLGQGRRIASEGQEMNDASRTISNVAIIGGGPAGMFAAYYAGVRQMSVKLIERMPQLGGQLAALYPEKYIYDVAGFPKVRAQELVDNLKKQMDLFRTDVRLEEKVLNVRKLDERFFEIETDRYAKAVIVTAGDGAFEPRRLELPLAERFEKTNLHYFVSDMERFRGKNVLICGGGDSALDWELMLEPIADTVTLVHCRDRFRAHKHSVELLMRSKVNAIVTTEITSIHGEDRIERVELTDVKTQLITLANVDEVIINYGFVSSLGPIGEWGLAVEGGSLIVD